MLSFSTNGADDGAYGGGLLLLVAFGATGMFALLLLLGRIEFEGLINGAFGYDG